MKIRIATLLSVSAAALALAVAPAASADQSCQGVGQGGTLCQSPGNSQLSVTPQVQPANPFFGTSPFLLFGNN